MAARGVVVAGGGGSRWLQTTIISTTKSECGAVGAPQPFPNVIPGLDVMSLRGELNAK